MWLIAGLVLVALVSWVTTSVFGLWALPFNCIFALYVGFHIPDWEERFGSR